MWCSATWRTSARAKGLVSEAKASLRMAVSLSPSHRKAQELLGVPTIPCMVVVAPLCTCPYLRKCTKLVLVFGCAHDIRIC